MQFYKLVIFILFIGKNCFQCFGEPLDENLFMWPTIVISTLIRNKAHSLPYFFRCVRNLNYPKHRLHIWIHTDYNEDKSEEIIEKWAKRYGSDYNGVYISTNKSNEVKIPTQWNSEHFEHIINLRERALEYGRKIWADYIFMLDADAYITNPDTLRILVSKNLPIVAPMLISDGLYSNFWCGMSEDYYYERTDDYKPIQSRESTGCLVVPMVHTAVLVSLRLASADRLTYDPRRIHNVDNCPNDDIIAFALNCKNIGVELHICNEHVYGFVQVPLEDGDPWDKDVQQLVNVKLEAISHGLPLPIETLLAEFVDYPEPSKLGCDEIYLINLERRPERRALMELSFKELGMDVKLFPAVDGRSLDLNNLEKYSITLMPGYEDPYHKRPMKAGEVGCFLSHYNIWKEVSSGEMRAALVLEDDVHFAPHFRDKFQRLLSEIQQLNWDLVYIGRKVLSEGEEWSSAHTQRPLYSYWTLGYLLSAAGARKLLAASPLRALLPVDEFLPIMFDKHPNVSWTRHYPVRDVVALSAAPLLVHPTHYVGQRGYVSDTEDSHLLINRHTHNTQPAINTEL